MDFNKVFQSKIFRIIIASIAALIILILVFGAGVLVGQIKAKFSYRWAENYHKNFGGPPQGFFGNMPRFFDENFMPAHGTFGEIIQINDSGLVIKGQNDMEKVIVVDKNTKIIIGRDIVGKDSLKVGDRVAVIGSPNNQGQIEAKLIRLFDKESKELLYRNPSSSRFF